MEEAMIILPTGFNADNSNSSTTDLAFFYREDTPDTFSLTNLMKYNDLPVDDIAPLIVNPEDMKF
jgi:hypothetical protein